MKLSMKAVVAIFVSVAVLSPAASARRANPPSPMNFSYMRSPVRQSPVEQYLPTVVTNTTFTSRPPFGCSWDVDDNSRAVGMGQLAAGASASFTSCQVIESYNSPTPSVCQTQFATQRRCGFPVGILVFSDSAKVRATLCFDPGPCFTPTPHFDKPSRMYRAWACVRAVYPYGSPLDQPIAGSGGGHGVLTNETITLTNPSSKAVNKNSAYFDQIGWYQGPGGGGPVVYGSADPSDYCYYDNVDENTDGTFRWSLS